MTRFLGRTPAALRFDRRETLDLLVLGGLVAALLWPLWILVPLPGLDPGWHAGVGLAGQLHLHWGIDLVFTYGPLSPLDYPLASSASQVLVSSIAWILTTGALVFVTSALVRSQRDLSRRRALLLTAAIVAVLIAPTGSSTDRLLLTVALLGSALVFVTGSLGAIAMVGIACGLLGQEKVSDAIFAFGVAALFAVGVRGWRGAIAMGATTATAFLAGWLLAGQALADLPPYLASAVEVVRGYPQALGYEDPALAWQYVVAAVLAVLLPILSWRISGGRPRGQRLCLVAGVGFGLFAAGHEGFIRHDQHALFFFDITLALAVVLLFAQPITHSKRLGGFAAIASLVTLVVINGNVLAPLDRTPSLRSLGTTAGILVNPATGTALTAQA